MSELIPAEEHETFSMRQDRRVVATVLWRRDAIVGIVVVRRRDGRSSLIPVPGFAQPTLARGFSRESVCRLWGCLRLAVEWALGKIEFGDVRGFALDPLLNGEEPAECGNLRAFGGELMCVDIGEFETQKPRLLI